MSSSFSSSSSSSHSFIGPFSPSVLNSFDSDDEGFDPNLFINPIADEAFVCSICNDVVNKPFDIPCGDLFCRQCLIKAVYINNNPHNNNCSCCSLPRLCPNCRFPISPLHLLHPNRAIRKIINSWSIRCPNSSLGCEWKDTIGFEERNYRNHKKNCDYLIIQCEDCEKPYQRKCKQDHDRICEGKGFFQKNCVIS